MSRAGTIAFVAIVVLMALVAAALVAGGVWLIALGGSWFYVLAGVGFAVSAALLALGRAEGLAVYAALVLATLGWALWEVGLDWWPLAARGGMVLVIGAALLSPFVARRLRRGAWTGSGEGPQTRTAAAPRLALVGCIAVALAVGVGSWFVDHEPATGALRGAGETAAITDAPDIPPGEWRAYGRTGFGQRYSPLDQITPANVGRLEEVWRYQTGDVSQPGDPVETTFQVTPLKIGDLLYLCTPHQNVIAVDATTGEEAWRFDPEIRGELALQHLTCRGLSYRPPGAGQDAAAPAPPPQGGAADGAAVGTASELGARGALTSPQAEGEPSAPPSGDDAPGGGAAVALPIAARTADRTVAACDAMLFMPTADGRIIALDPSDGAVCTSFGGGAGQINLWDGMPHPTVGGYYSTSPVVVTADLIIVGGTVLDNVSVNQPSGVIRAYDVRTGALAWAFDPGEPDRAAPLAPGETYSVSSPNSWSISAVDEALGMVYIPFGNQPPDQWGAERSEAVERFSSSVVALNLDDGSLAWVFQTVHHDLWDYDVPSQPSLIDLTVNGARTPALVQPTKQGEVYVLNRETGEPLLPVVEQPVPQGAVAPDFTAPTQPVSALSFDPPPLEGRDMWGATLIDQMACRIAFRRYRYDGRYTPPTLEGTLVYPGNFGVFNWGGVAVDPVWEVMFGTPAYLAFVSRLVPRPDDETFVVNREPPEGSLPALNENFGAPYAVELKPFTSFLGIPCQAPPWGYVAGADLRTGEVAWMRKNGTVRDFSPIPVPLKLGVPDLGGPVMTAGGVAFISGTLDYFVRGYDVTTGAQLWEARLPAGGQATPMTYLARDGRQHLLVVAGGHGSLGTRRGDSVIAYALPAREP